MYMISKHTRSSSDSPAY